VTVSLSSTSTRTFLVLPAVALAEAAVVRRRPRLRWLPLLHWGYLQYRLGGRYRSARTGGGPGMGTPPERLVTTGVYALTRNPMYLGHLVFLTGLALTTRSARYRESVPRWLARTRGSRAVRPPPAS
jgi:protein-S-isoprenylcysteine O-methyltransferase Ste14